MTLLDRLRTETRMDRVRVETELDLLSNELTLDRYGRVIQRLHAFVLAWEPLAEPTLGSGFYGPRRKLPWLEHDLQVLGLPRSSSSCRCRGSRTAPRRWAPST